MKKMKKMECIVVNKMINQFQLLNQLFVIMVLLQRMCMYFITDYTSCKWTYTTEVSHVGWNYLFYWWLCLPSSTVMIATVTNFIAFFHYSEQHLPPQIALIESLWTDTQGNPVWSVTYKIYFFFLPFIVVWWLLVF